MSFPRRVTRPRRAQDAMGAMLYVPGRAATLPDANGNPAAEVQFTRDQVTERQISPPITQPCVVSVLPESDMRPE